MFIPIWLVVLGGAAIALWVIIIVAEVIIRISDGQDYSEFDLSLPNNPKQSREIYELERENFWYRKHIEKTNADYMKTLDELNNANNYIDHLVEEIRRLESNKGKSYDKLDLLVNNSSDIYISYDNGWNDRELKVGFEFRNLPMSQWDRVFEIMNEIAKLREENK